ncbi:MAG: DUF2188 domain-containing protein [Deltaproteobacteria bacterium]
MVKMKTFHVLPSEKPPGWKIEEEPEGKVFGPFTTKVHAVKEARKMAKIELMARIVIHRSDGPVQRDARQKI